ncbi:MAG: HAD hydrolase-like protein, partial [Pseudomonadota bacterium]|nr:HAD hydrolase-like protein [Pseudomonadota bacterium]
FLAADHLGLQASHCAYVGDHARDIQAGLAAGMPTIAAAYGYHMGDVDSWGADYTVQSATEFKALFKKETVHG